MLFYMDCYFFFRDLHLYYTLFIKEKIIARKLYGNKISQFTILTLDLNRFNFSQLHTIRLASLYCRLTITCIVVISNCVLKDRDSSY